MEIGKAKDLLVSPDETVMATIGANYLQNILSGQKVKRGYALLTEKRLYYHGKSFQGTGKNLVSATEECVISSEDITKTGFVHTRLTGALIWGVLLILVGIPIYASYYSGAPGYGWVWSIFKPICALGIAFWIAGAICIVMSFVKRRTLFEIAFPGGKFLFDIKWYPIADMQDFQRQLHLVKDHIKNA